tara:strand:- start:123 stop:1112 length:990 start_codon:yes stop_codon:yes gene_type:complete
LSYKNISIIGGKGFLGTNLAKILNDSKFKYSIFDKKYDKKHINFLDVTNLDNFNKLKESDVWINLSAMHRDDVRPISLYDEVNVGGAKNLCIMAEKYDVKTIIFTSSVAIYGFAPEGTDEQGEPNYFNDYGRTKYLAEKVYIEWQRKDPLNRKLIIIRPTVIFGEGNRGNVFNLLNQIASKRFIMIGKGNNKKSMAYVLNVASFIKYSLTSFDNGLHIFNYIDKPDINMNQLVSYSRKFLFNKKNVGIRIPRFLGIFIGKFADLINYMFNLKLPISSIRVEKFTKTTSFNTSINETSFIPPFSLEEGLKRTLNYEFVEDNSEKEIFFTE